MRKFVTSTFIALTLTVVGLMLAGCGGSGGGMSSQVLSGNASAGAPLAGQVSLKDSSSPPQQKTTVIGIDGSFAFDVTGLKAPYILQGTGTAAGTAYKLLSFGDGAGIANVNPFSNVMVAGAAGVNDPEQIYSSPDPATLLKIKSGLPRATSDLLNQLQPLLRLYSATGKDPIKDHYDADHQGLDGLLDSVKITIPNGIITITNVKTGAVIFTANVADIKNGHFSSDPTSLPQPSAMPVTPSGVSAVSGTGQVAISWNAVSNAVSYNLYYATTSGITTASGTKISNVTSPFVQSGLAAGASYYYIVTAVNSAGESSASAQVSAGPGAGAAVPVSPSGVITTGGTRQVTISWNAVSTAASYNVYYATKSGVTTANGTKLANATSPAVQTGLADASNYYYIVTAVNSSGEGTASVQTAATTLSTTPSPTAPAVPAGLSAVGGANKVTLSWVAVTGASSYNIYWSTSSSVTAANGTKMAGITSPYVQTGLAAGTTYYYVVTAVNSVGESQASIRVPATTSASVTPVAKQLALAWDPVAGATSYNLYWSTAPGVTKSNGTKISGVVSSSYVHTGLAAGTTYYYVVTAVNSSSESVASSSASGTTTL